MVGQVFLIGLGLLGGVPSGVSLHRDFGWMLHLLPLLILLFAALSRAGRRHWQWALALAIVVFLVPIFAILRDSAAVLAALHPVAAVFAFPLALVVATNSVRALRASAAERLPAGTP
jgi:hypothetical protein